LPARKSKRKKIKARTPSHKQLGLRAYRKRNYVEAVSHLEKALTRSKHDVAVYVYLGSASLMTGDMEGARRYFRGGLLVDEGNPDLLKGMAYVYLQDDRIEDAVSMWGEALDRRPGDRTVREALEKLRAADRVSDVAKSIDLRSYLAGGIPLTLRLKPYLLGLGITAGIILLFALFYLTPLYRMTLQKFYPEIAELNSLVLPEDVDVTVDNAEEARYSFTDEEIRASFLRIKKYIYREKTNTAIIALNRIMLSNASPIVKERFDILYTFIDPPDPLSVDFVPRLYEIMKEPAAYRGVYVVWRGKIANLEKEGNTFSFDLLVNYENEDTIEGIAHVSLTGTYYIENRQNVEVFGVLEGVDRELGAPRIRGILLKDLHN
jgi:hypothetical protein